MNFRKLSEKQVRYTLLAFLLLVCLVTFSLQIWKGYPDIPDHNRFITRWLGGDKEVKLYSLYYLVILVLSLFQNNPVLISIISVLLLTVSVASKFLLANYIFKREWKRTKPAAGDPALFRFPMEIKSIILLLVALLCICGNLIWKPSATMALGYLPVNTWHNSTTIFLMPFVLWLFYKSYLYLLTQKKGETDWYALVELLLLTIFSVFIKPSYFFVFSIAFPLYYLLRFGITRNLFLTGLVSALSAFALLLVYRYVYTGTESSVTIDPFHVWNYWTTNIPLSVLASILFPLLFLACYFRQTLQSHLLSYAWVQMIVAILIYSLLTETGGREMHGNFGWQTIICNFLLFFCTWIVYLRILSAKKSLEGKDRVLISIFLLHVAAGMLFLLKLPLYGAR